MCENNLKASNLLLKKLVLFKIFFKKKNVWEIKQRTRQEAWYQGTRRESKQQNRVEVDKMDGTNGPGHSSMLRASLHTG